MEVLLGMMAALQASKENNQVILLEKMNSLGKKLLITGKGRCNITSSLPIDEFTQNVPGNGMFLYSCFSKFTNEDIIQLLASEGLEVKEERGHRIFPITNQAKDVLDVFLRLLKKQKVEMKTRCKSRRNNFKTRQSNSVCNAFFLVEKKELFMQIK